MSAALLATTLFLLVLSSWHARSSCVQDVITSVAAPSPLPWQQPSSWNPTHVPYRSNNVHINSSVVVNISSAASSLRVQGTAQLRVSIEPSATSNSSSLRITPTCQDVTPPTLLRSHPGHDSSGVSLFTPVELVFVFNEPVNPAVNATALISVASTAPSASNPQILLVTGIHRINTSAFRFTLNGQLQREGNQYTVSVQPSAFHDLAEPPLSSGAITFKFNATADSLPPILDLAASWPRPNSTVNASIDPLFGIRMIFNEPVRRVPGFSSGSAPVSVYDVADDAHTAVSGTVSEWFDGTTLRVNFSQAVPLLERHTYAIFIADGFIEDESVARNVFAGLAPGVLSWNFTAGDTTPPTVLSVSPQPNSDINIEDQTFMMTFSESILPISSINNSTVVFTISIGGQPQLSSSVYPPGVSNVVQDGNSTLTITIPQFMVAYPGRLLTIKPSPGVLRDLSSNALRTPINTVSGPLQDGWTVNITSGLPNALTRDPDRPAAISRLMFLRPFSAVAQAANNQWLVDLKTCLSSTLALEPNSANRIALNNLGGNSTHTWVRVDVGVSLGSSVSPQGLVGLVEAQVDTKGSPMRMAAATPCQDVVPGSAASTQVFNSPEVPCEVDMRYWFGLAVPAAMIPVVSFYAYLTADPHPVKGTLPRDPLVFVIGAVVLEFLDMASDMVFIAINFEALSDTDQTLVTSALAFTLLVLVLYLAGIFVKKPNPLYYLAPNHRCERAGDSAPWDKKEIAWLHAYEGLFLFQDVIIIIVTVIILKDSGDCNDLSGWVSIFVSLAAALKSSRTMGFALWGWILQYGDCTGCVSWADKRRNKRRRHTSDSEAVSSIELRVGTSTASMRTTE